MLGGIGTPAESLPAYGKNPAFQGLTCPGLVIHVSSPAFSRHRQVPVNEGNYILFEADMKPEIHPAYNDIKVTCSCGSSFETRSTVGKDLSIEVCSQCHPFYTGKQKIVDAGGRVDKFRRRYGRG
jgi:large subunit ribosomal protein L31